MLSEKNEIKGSLEKIREKIMGWSHRPVSCKHRKLLKKQLTAVLKHFSIISCEHCFLFQIILIDLKLKLEITFMLKIKR